MLQNMAQEILARAPKNVIRQALLHQSSGKVRKPVPVDESTVRGWVTLATWYEVKLNLNSLADSRCSCRATTPCEHMVAVFAACYTPHGDPSQVLSGGTTVRHPKAVPVRTPNAGPRPSSGDSVYAWISFMERQSHGGRNPLSAGSLSALDRRLRPLANTWPMHRRNAWALVLDLFLATKALETMDAITDLWTLYEWSQSTWAQIFPRVLQVIMEDNQKFWPLSGEDVDALEGLAARLLEGGLPLTGQFSPTALYHSLWLYAFPPFHRDREIARLQDEIGELGTPSERLTQALLGLMTLQDRAAEARSHLTKLGRIEDLSWLLAVLDGLSFMERCEEGCAWASLGFEATGQLPSFRKAVIEYWQSMERNLPVDKRTLELHLRADLPHSTMHYLQYLFNEQFVERAVEFAMGMDILPTLMTAESLKSLWDGFPDAMTGWYHQSIETLISGKTRQNYEMGADLLVELGRQYRKGGRKSEWNLYMEQLKTKHRRLRALYTILLNRRLIGA